MNIQDTLTSAQKALEGAQISFALIGGFALAAHGVVRATQDIDLLVDGAKKSEAHEVLTAAGFKVVYATEEVVHFSGKGQLDIVFANRESTKEMLKRAQRINDFPVPVVSAEDIIGLKIQAYKNDAKREYQDKADIQALINSGKSLDFQLIKKYADLFDEWSFIVKLRAEI